MKAIKVCVFIISLIPIAAYALSVDECTSGRTVYIDKLFDIEAIVIKNDYSDDTCYVRLNNGDTKWVKASDLMGVFGKKVEDWVEEKAADFILGCLFGDKCKSTSSGSN